jgi:LPXTG-site transpeptidase (sortase) family protein
MVPLNKGSWDVTWLGDNAGYLEGSAFPTYPGNTVITAHVWDANNNPGPFAGLKTLKYGDTIKINAFGQTYTYEVRENTLITSQNKKSLLKPEDYDWLTLLTCESYDPRDQAYLFHRMVRGVLVNVD